MISEDDAKSIVLKLCNADAGGEKFVIQSCKASPRGDYWIVRSNSEAYVIHGDFERCYVGVSARLVNAITGEVETVGSGSSWQEYLQDKYDVEIAAGLHYVLEPAFDVKDKAALVNLRQRLVRSYQETIALVSPEHRHWLTGKLRVLKIAQTLLKEQGIEASICLREKTLGAALIDERIWHWEALVPCIKIEQIC